MTQQYIPGYNHEGETRGAQRELTELEQANLNRMKQAAGSVLHGYTNDVRITMSGSPELGYDPAEEVRDQFWHELGMGIGLDVDGVLTQNEEPRIIELDSGTAQSLEFAKGTSLQIPGVVRSLAIKRPGDSVVVIITEVEMPNLKKRVDGTIGTRYSRIINFSAQVASETPAEAARS